MNRRDFGRLGEEAAALYLEKKGYRILGHNLRAGHDETDLLAESGNILVFCEVKTRRQYPDLPDRFGAPGDAVNAKKRASLIRGAEGYLAGHPEYAERLIRIDVIEVFADPAAAQGEEFRVLEIRHTENAVRKTGKFSRNAARGTDDRLR